MFVIFIDYAAVRGGTVAGLTNERLKSASRRFLVDVSRIPFGSTEFETEMFRELGISFDHHPCRTKHLVRLVHRSRAGEHFRSRLVIRAHHVQSDNPAD